MQLWLLAQKNATTHAVGRRQTNIQVIPIDAYERHVPQQDTDDTRRFPFMLCLHY